MAARDWRKTAKNSSARASSSRYRSSGRSPPPGQIARGVGAQLAGDESDGEDAMALGRVEQPRTRAVARRLVLEDHLIEAGERVADVALVVDGEAPATLWIDIREVAVAQP